MSQSSSVSCHLGSRIDQSHRNGHKPASVVDSSSKTRGENVLVTADCEHGTITELSTAVDHAGFHRALGKRQIMMMTFGAGIGTGLWVGTGTALRYGISTYSACTPRSLLISICSWSRWNCYCLYNYCVIFLRFVFAVRLTDLASALSSTYNTCQSAR